MSARLCPICEITDLGDLCTLCHGKDTLDAGVYKHIMSYNYTEKWNRLCSDTPWPYLIAVSCKTNHGLQAKTHSYRLICTQVNAGSFKVESIGDLREIPKEFPWSQIPKVWFSEEDILKVGALEPFNAYVVYNGRIPLITQTKPQAAQTKPATVSTKPPTKYTLAPNALADQVNRGGVHILGNRISHLPEYIGPRVLYVSTEPLNGKYNGHFCISAVNTAALPNGLVYVMGTRTMENVRAVDARILKRLGVNTTGMYVKTEGCPQGNGGIFGGEGSFYGGINPLSLAVRTTHKAIHQIPPEGDTIQSLVNKQLGTSQTWPAIKGRSGYYDTVEDYDEFGHPLTDTSPYASAYRGVTNTGGTYNHTSRFPQAYRGGKWVDIDKRAHAIIVAEGVNVEEVEETFFLFAEDKDA